jgi:hypothetical protein
VRRSASTSRQEPLAQVGIAHILAASKPSVSSTLCGGRKEPLWLPIGVRRGNEVPYNLAVIIDTEWNGGRRSGGLEGGEDACIIQKCRTSPLDRDVDPRDQAMIIDRPGVAVGGSRGIEGGKNALVIELIASFANGPNLL